LQVPGALATYYLLKAERFPYGSTENVEWHRKALGVLLRADEILRVSEKIFDNLQVAHGKPVPPRRPAQQLYLILGNAHAGLRNFPEAFAAYRYGRGIAPTWSELYDRETAARRLAGDFAGAARLELEKAFALRLSPALLTSVQQAYAGLPGGGCAVNHTSGIPLLNLDCPRLKDDICPALSELVSVFTEARQPERAREFARLEIQYACAGGR
jgi:hypothetical protein